MLSSPDVQTHISQSVYACSSQFSAQSVQGLEGLDGPTFLDEGFMLPELEALLQDPVGESGSL